MVIATVWRPTRWTYNKWFWNNNSNFTKTTKIKYCFSNHLESHFLISNDDRVKTLPNCSCLPRYTCGDILNGIDCNIGLIVTCVGQGTCGQFRKFGWCLNDWCVLFWSFLFCFSLHSYTTDLHKRPCVMHTCKRDLFFVTSWSLWARHTRFYGQKCSD